MKLTIDLDKLENPDLLNSLKAAAAAYIRNRQSGRTSITAAAVKSKIKEMESHPTFENAGLADVLRAQLPEIEASERKAFSPERYRQELSTRWPVQYQYLERSFIDPNDPMAPEKLEILDAIEQEGNQCNQRPDLFKFETPTGGHKDRDAALWERVKNNSLGGNDEE